MQYAATGMDTAGTVHYDYTEQKTEAAPDTSI